MSHRSEHCQRPTGKPGRAQNTDQTLEPCNLQKVDTSNRRRTDRVFPIRPRLITCIFSSIEKSTSGNIHKRLTRGGERPPSSTELIASMIISLTQRIYEFNLDFTLPLVLFHHFLLPL
uniref:Uncharacterized protein n=1 Tax=Ananas comosus var. bracteatus TaxID=296719 RepID=A0A6V7QGV4_ANACO|nr:unnamed protein product [Ananas comosus var. bracteatus]